MRENEDPIPAAAEGMGAPTTEAALRLRVTDLLLGRSRDVRAGLSTLEQWEILHRIEAALEAYGSYFYPTERR